MGENRWAHVRKIALRLSSFRIAARRNIVGLILIGLGLRAPKPGALLAATVPRYPIFAIQSYRGAAAPGKRRSFTDFDNQARPGLRG